jgi:CPA2 family monovalent cation:H+ antiporter-2
MRHKCVVTGFDFIRDLAIVMLVAGAVGWIFQRLQLSVVVGYLLAGVIIGPFTPPFQLVQSQERVQMLAELGLVFLIFAIGLELSLRRLQRMGFSVIVATLVSSVLILNGCRLIGAAIGLTAIQGLFLAAILMVSSSAIISKVLEEINANHLRSGQLALGMTVLEDVVAVVMLTLLTSMVQFSGENAPSILAIIAAFAGFVVLLGMATLLFVPRFLTRLSLSSSPELRMLLVVGMLLGLGCLAVKAGYSLALAAFVLGVIIGSTRQKGEMERLFEGVRHMFGAVFFVAMGMMFDIRLLFSVWPTLLALTALVIVGRSAAAALGLLAVGNSLRESVRAGLAVTPLGEFSFILASLGVSAKVMPESFYPLAVGASFLTSLLAPLLMRRSEAIAETVEARLPKALREWITFYHEWLDRLMNRQQSSVLWRLTSKRLAQTALHLLFISGAIIAAHPVYTKVKSWLGQDWLFTNGVTFVFWTIFGLVLLAPLVALWRNISALALIFAEAATKKEKRRRILCPLIENAIRTVAGVVIMAWLIALVPGAIVNRWLVIGILIVLGGAAAIFWRRLVFLHSRVEIELQEQIKSATESTTQSNWSVPRFDQEDWGLQLDEIVLPDDSEHAGKPIKTLRLRTDWGSSIIGIDRGGYALSNPSPDEHVYPGDKLLLLGSPEKLPASLDFLNRRAAATEQNSFDELNTETVAVPLGSRAAGKTMIELDLIRRFQVQIGGIERRGQRIVPPAGTDRVEGGDQLLVLGTHQQIRHFENWLSEAD